MKKSIEAIWKEGFLNEKSLVVPKINDLYNQKSIHLVDKMRRMYRINLIFLVIMAIVIPIVYYFLDVPWQGVAGSILLLLFAGYSRSLKRSFKTLDHGATSLDYLKSFDRWLKDRLLRGEKVLRFIHPLSFLIVMSTVWPIMNKSGQLNLVVRQTFPDLIFIGNVPLVVLIIVGVGTIVIYYFSGRIHRWDVRLMYGGVFDKLEETIAEMEKLKQG